MANHMAEVAKILGVELGERFKIVDVDYDYVFNYYLSEDGIKIDEEDMECEPDLLRDLICGVYTIKHKPWKPKNNVAYWYVCPDGSVEYDTWWECAQEVCDINLYKLGNCYRTREEAEANRDKWVAFYGSDEVLEI